MSSPLQLKEYVFVKTCVETNRVEGEVSKAIAVNTDIQLAQGKAEQEWVLRLTVRTEDSGEEAKPPAYKADVVVVGRFDVDPGFPKEKTPRMVAITGASILYGVAREMIANITARSVYGIFTLPMTSFVDLEPQKVS